MKLLFLVAVCCTLAWAAPPDGKALFAKNCAQCHGQGGKGDGPQSAVYDPKPSDLTAAVYKRGTTDKQVFKAISKGIPGTPMEAFGDKLSEAEREALVGYLKVLRGEK